MKQKLFLTTIMLMAICSFSNAQTPKAYAVYTSGDKTLTFRYDNEWEELANSPTSVIYDMNTGENEPGWIIAKKKIETVEFTASFADYKPTSTYMWFYNLTELTEIYKMSNLKTDDVTNMAYMFYNCNKLTKVTVNSWNTSSVTDMSYMFFKCGDLQGLDLRNWDTSKVTDMKYMFFFCCGLSRLDLRNWDTGKVTDMSYMFEYCYGLYTLLVNGWDTGNVTNMSHMFASCFGLSKLDVSGWSTANVTDMSDMFYDCEQLKSLDLSDWDTSKVTSMSSMFLNCFSLTSINMCDKNAVNVISMNKMFSGCKSLTSLDLSGWDTEKLTNMSSMFYECNSLTSLDLSGWSTDNVTDMSSMFNGCKELTTIYVWNGWNTENVQYSTDMFSSCTKLVGGSGTQYNFMYKDATYARIDCPPSSPGYFSTYVIEYNISIAGTKVSTLNMGDVLGNGIFSYSPSTNTLTIIGSYTITSGWDDIIYSNIEGLTIDVTQDAVLENKGSGNVIMLVKSTTIKGEGKLTLKSPDVTGIYLSGGAPVTIENMNMDIEAYWGIAGPTNGLTREKITIKSSNITITTSTSTALNPTDAAAISDLPGGIVLEDCSIIYPANATIQNKGVYLGNSTTLAKDVTIKAKVGISTGGVERLNDNGQMINDKAWFTIDGRKLNGKPTQKGIYIQNGNKRIIK